MLRINYKKVAVPILMIIILMYSGSLFYMSHNVQLQYGMLGIALIAFLIANKNGLLNNFIRTSDTYCISFIWLYAISMLVNMFTESGMGFALYYLYELLLFIVGYIIICLVPYERFKKCYINIITIIAAVSLICWLIPDAIRQIAPFNFVRGSWRFSSLFFYNLNLAVPTRNCGPFWEPGMYQAYLCFAMLLIVTDSKEKHQWGRLLILSFTVITTFSSTGYFLLVVVLMLKLYQSRQPVHKFVWSVLVIIVGTVLILNIQNVLNYIDQYTLYSVGGKFYSDGNESVATRLYSGICDIEVAFTHPFGVNRANAETLRRLVATQYGKVTASTNTFTTILVYFGWIPCIAYAALWVRGCCRFQRTVINRILSIIMIVAIMMTELHVDLWFLQIIVLYWSSCYEAKGNMLEARFEVEESSK